MIFKYIKSRWSQPCGYKEILDLAWPLILSASAVTIQQFVDRIFLSWYSSEALAAAAPSGAFSFLAIGLFIGIVGYSNAFIAQYNGAGLNNRISSCVWQAIYLSIIFSALILCILPFSEKLFTYTGHSFKLRVLEIQYFNIMIVGAFFSICGSAVSGFFMGLGKTRILLAANICATIVNIILDYLLIFGKFGFPEMGIKGAAYATIAAMAVSFIILTAILFNRSNRNEFQTHLGWKLNSKLIARMMKYGFPNGLQLTIDCFVWSMFLLFVGRLGTVELAATTLAFQINSVSFMPVIGVGTAVAIIAARELGKNMADNAVKSAVSALHLSGVYNALIAVLYVGLPIIFIYPFTSKADPESAKQLFNLSVILLRFLAIYTVADSLSIIFASVLRGAGDTLFVMGAFFVLGIGFLMLPVYYAVQPEGGGLIWAWSFVTIYIFLLSITFFFRFRQGKWKHMRVIEHPSIIYEG